MRPMPRLFLTGWLFCLLLAGCGGGAAPVLEGRRTPVRLNLLLISAKQVEHFQWVEQAFEAENPNIDLIIEQFPGSSLKDFEIKLRLRFSSRQAPEVFHVHENVAAELARLGLLAPALPEVERFVQTESRTEMIRQAPYFAGTCFGITSDAVSSPPQGPSPNGLHTGRTLHCRSS